LPSPSLSLSHGKVAQYDRARLQRSAAHQGAHDGGQDHREDAFEGVAILYNGFAADLHPDDRKTRAPLDRLVRDGKIEFKRVKGVHGSFPEQMLNYGYDPQLSEDAVKQPVFLTSTFVFRTAEDGQDFFDFVSGRREPPEGMGAGLVYSRFNHPTARSSSTGSLFTSAPRNARYSRPACRRLRPRFSPSFAQAT
jgi:hypothetical protein